MFNLYAITVSASLYIEGGYQAEQHTCILNCSALLDIPKFKLVCILSFAFSVSVDQETSIPNVM